MYKNSEQLIENLEKETTAFYNKVDESRRIDNSFAKFSDIPLTQEEIDQIDQFWGKYKFAYPNIDYQSFQTFKNRCGYFDVRHCPGAIRTSYFNKYFVNSLYSTPFQHKAMLAMLYPDIPQPKTVVRRMNNILYDEDYNVISLDEAINVTRKYLNEWGGVIVKLNGSSGGKGILFWDTKDASQEKLHQYFTKTLGVKSFVIQRILTQSPFMDAFNASSVNTIRITTLLFKGKIYHLAALIRIGNSGSQVDNWCSGGSLLGVDILTGECYSWAMTNDKNRLTRLPSGLDLANVHLIIPNFSKIKDMIARAHYRIPYIKMISWDIALDQNDEPNLIECNFAGMIQIHEAITGPLFGDLIGALCDEYLLKKFCTRFATNQFLCREYHDHVVITEYIGDDNLVIIPETLHKKPVTSIERKAFVGCNIQEIILLESLALKCTAALSSIPHKITVTSLNEETIHKYTQKKDKGKFTRVLDFVRKIYK